MKNRIHAALLAVAVLAPGSAVADEIQWVRVTVLLETGPEFAHRAEETLVPEASTPRLRLIAEARRQSMGRSSNGCEWSARPCEVSKSRCGSRRCWPASTIFP